MIVHVSIRGTFRKNTVIRRGSHLTLLHIDQSMECKSHIQSRMRRKRLQKILKQRTKKTVVLYVWCTRKITWSCLVDTCVFVELAKHLGRLTSVQYVANQTSHSYQSTKAN